MEAYETQNVVFEHAKQCISTYLTGTQETNVDTWFTVNLRNIPYNTCNITTGSDLRVDGSSSKCTLTLNVIYCGNHNAIDVYEFSIIESERIKNNNIVSRAHRQLRSLIAGVDCCCEDPKLYTNKYYEVMLCRLVHDHFLDDNIKKKVLALNATDIERLIDITETDEIFSSLSKVRVSRVGRVLFELEALLHHGNLSISSDEVHNVLDQVDHLLDIDEIEEIPGELLHGLDMLGTRFVLDTNFTGSVVRDNVAVIAADSTASRQVRGIRVAATAHDAFVQNAFQFMTVEDEDLLQTTSDVNEALILLPYSATKVDRRISVVAFRTNRSFLNDHSCQLNSKVFSINVENYTHFEEGETIDIYLKPWQRFHHRNQSRACAYWHFNDNGTGFWSQEGCTITKAHQEGTLDLCQCNHLTHFAEILIKRNVFSESDESVLEIISIIGCCFSLFGLTVIALTAALFKSWRVIESNKIWLNLGSAVFILDVCFLVTVFVDFDESVAGCVVVGVALHYSVLATFCWMLVVSVLSFRKLVLVFNSELPFKLLITALFAWGFPCFVIGILFTVNPKAYSGRFEDMTPSGTFCYPKGVYFWVSVFAPMAVMWLTNWILYAIIVRSMFESKKNIRRHTSSKETLRCASISCLLAFLCGIPWVFGFFAYNIVAAYLFSITVTFQGFVLFLFFVLGNKKTRGLWIGLLRRRAGRAAITTSANRSNNEANTARILFLSRSSATPQNQASGALLTESRL